MQAKTKTGEYVVIKEETRGGNQPNSSSLYRIITETTETKVASSTENDQLMTEERAYYQTNNFEDLKKHVSLGYATLNYIAQVESEFRESIISQYSNEIQIVILQDIYIDGETSDSEHYILDRYNQGQIDYVADALMEVYSSNLGEAHILEGILTMISCVPYDAIAPKGQIMAMGLLTNKNLSVRDKAIQCFEKWNSKKGLAYLKNIECSPAWLQKYVNKVIKYIERDGNE